VLPHKRSHNSIAALLAGRRQWLHLMDHRQSQRLTGRRRANLMDRRQVSLTGHLQGKA
jgi:hypothetical protein